MTATAIKAFCTCQQTNEHTSKQSEQRSERELEQRKNFTYATVFCNKLFFVTKIGKRVFPSLTTPRQHEGDQQRTMAHQPMAAVVHFVLGFLVLVSKHNEVAMVRRHERCYGGRMKLPRYISLSMGVWEGAAIEFHPGPPCTTLLHHPALWPFQGWPARRVACSLRPSSTSLDSRRRTYMHLSHPHEHPPSRPPIFPLSFSPTSIPPKDQRNGNFEGRTDTTEIIVKIVLCCYVLCHYLLILILW
jgi:hypothetical protein